MRRVEFDAPAVGRFRAELQVARPRRLSAHARAVCWALGFLVILAHAAERSGCFFRGDDKPLRGGRTASHREIQTWESSEMNPIRGVVVAGVAASGVAHGADLFVPSKSYSTIQSAVDAANDGDTIHLAAGQFVESVLVQGKSIVIRGAAQQSTIWRAPKGLQCLSIPDGSVIPFELSDLTVTGSASTYGHASVDLQGSGAKRVVRCTFSQNSGWAALNVYGDGSTVADCLFVQNGLGASIAFGQGISMQRCEFRDNSQTQSAGGGPWAPADLDAYACTLSVQQCQFINGSSDGAPVRVYATVDFDQCAFSSGEGGVASAIQAYDSVATVRLGQTSFCESPEPRLAGTARFIDLGGNSVSEFCAPLCPADLVPDNTVNGADIAIVLNFWGTDGSQFPGVDIDADGIVNGADLAAVLNAWGPCQQ